MKAASISVKTALDRLPLFAPGPRRCAKIRPEGNSMARGARAEDLVVVRTYTYRHEAEIARSVLEAHSIHTMIQADDFGGLQPMVGASTGGVRLLVRRADEQEAKRLLRA